MSSQQSQDGLGGRKRHRGPALVNENIDGTSKGSKKQKVTATSSPVREEPHKGVAAAKMAANDVVEACIYFTTIPAEPTEDDACRGKHDKVALYNWKRFFMLNLRYIELSQEETETLAHALREHARKYHGLKQKINAAMQRFRYRCAKIDYQAVHQLENPWIPEDEDKKYEEQLKVSYESMRSTKKEPSEDKNVCEMSVEEACKAARYFTSGNLPQRGKVPSIGRIKLLKDFKRLFVLHERLCSTDPQSWPSGQYGYEMQEALEGILGRLKFIALVIQDTFGLSEKTEESDLPSECLDMKRDSKAEYVIAYKQFFSSNVLCWTLEKIQENLLNSLLPDEMKGMRKVPDVKTLDLPHLNELANDYLKWQWPSRTDLNVRQRRTLALKVWKRLFLLLTGLSVQSKNTQEDNETQQLIGKLKAKETELIKEFKAAHEEAREKEDGPAECIVDVDCEMEHDKDLEWTFRARYQDVLGNWDCGLI